jgi:signal transduction histidine kinase/DNA-binding NarL/FixJ family response regulator
MTLGASGPLGLRDVAEAPQPKRANSIPELDAELVALLKRVELDEPRLPPTRKQWYAVLSEVQRVLSRRVPVEEHERLLSERVRQAEHAAAAADRAKDAFLANMSHELRTPMTVVLGAAQLLQETQLSAEQRELIDGARRAGDMMLGIINDLLDYSKIRAGKFDLSVRDFDVTIVLRELVEGMQRQARNKRLELELAIDPELGRWVRGDPLRLRQVLTNLLANAIKYTDSGHVRLSAQRSGENGGVRFTVSDTGMGIEPRYLERLFLPFAQGDEAVARRRGGTGLGLAIAKQLVELMGGCIGVHSELGQGSTFWFTAWLEPGSEQAARQASLTPQPGRRTTSGVRATGRRVLLAEDNAVTQMLVIRSLEKLGCQIDVVTTGREAVRAVLEREYDVVLMDWQMPDLDGIEATVEIREREAPERHVPIVALTANALPGDRDQCLAAGMDDYLAKPFSVFDLRRKVMSCLLGQPSPLSDDRSEARSTQRRPGRTPTLDDARLGRLLDATARPELLADLAEIFVQDTERRLNELSEASHRGDSEALARGAHAVKGSSGNMGAARLAELAAVLEHHCNMPRGPEMAALLLGLRAELERVRALLPKKLAAAAAGADSLPGFRAS